jgi:hypothetical protein
MCHPCGNESNSSLPQASAWLAGSASVATTAAASKIQSGRVDHSWSFALTLKRNASSTHWLSASRVRGTYRSGFIAIPSPRCSRRWGANARSARIASGRIGALALDALHYLASKAMVA